MKKLLFFPVVFLLFLSTLGNGNILVTQTGDTCGADNPVLTIDLLSPNTNPDRNAWAALMESEFPKACIGIDNHLSTDWNTIAARTWAYGGGVGFIPSFDNGGFDALFKGYSNPQAPVVTLDDLYASYQYSEDGGFNFIHYSNATFDELHREYSQTLDPAERDPLAYKMQEILYEDQPTLTILYGANVWLYAGALVDSIGENVAIGLSTASFSDAWKDLSGVNDIVYAHSYDIAEFVPQVANSYISNQFMNPIWQGMYARDLDNKSYIPVLAQSLPEWQNAEQTVARVDIRTDINFANGELMDIDDVYNSFLRILNPNVGDIGIATYQNYFGNPFLAQNHDDYRPMDQIIRTGIPNSLFIPAYGPNHVIFTISTLHNTRISHELIIACIWR